MTALDPIFTAMASESFRDWCFALGAIAVFFVGRFEYRKAQRWKRAEWVAAEMRAFLDDPKVHTVLTMLDWRERNIPILPAAREGEAPNGFEYEETQLIHALSGTTHPQTSPYKSHELAIRDCFDRFLDGLERLHEFVRAGLIEHTDLLPYLGYWAEIIGNQNSLKKTNPIRMQLWWYIQDYNYLGVQALFANFGYDIKPQS